jgi:hypothetical protein
MKNSPAKFHLQQRLHHCKQFIPQKSCPAPPPRLSFNLISGPNAPSIDLKDNDAGPALLNHITKLVDDIDYQSKMVDTARLEGAPSSFCISGRHPPPQRLSNYFPIPLSISED